MRRTLIRQQSVGGVVNRPALVTPGRRDIFEMETVQVRWHRNIVRVMRGLVRRSFTVNVNDARVNGETFSTMPMPVTGSRFSVEGGAGSTPPQAFPSPQDF